MMVAMGAAHQQERECILNKMNYFAKHTCRNTFFGVKICNNGGERQRDVAQTCPDLL
jgi:hypothetical protein